MLSISTQHTYIHTYIHTHIHQDEDESTRGGAEMDLRLHLKDDDVDGAVHGVDVEDEDDGDEEVDEEIDDDDDDEDPEDPNDPDIFRFSYTMPDFAQKVSVSKNAGSDDSRMRSPVFQVRSRIKYP
jgi:hypothetical protein